MGAATAWNPARVSSLVARLAEQVDDAVALRHAIHADPRTSGNEDDTTEMLLDALGLPAQRLPFGGAIVRIGDPEGPAIGLRAELDALPVKESTPVEWASTNGAMHACGHDVHMAAAYAVARTLAEMPGPLPLVLVLQPREETLPSGAADVVQSPEFAAHDLRAFLGVHVQPTLDPGTFSAAGGAVNAAADLFQIDVLGRPGHAAYPHLTADPVVAAADLVGSLQHLVSRQVDPTHPTVLTVGSINGGSSANVVPASVRMRGILRTFDEVDRVTLHGAIEDATRAVSDIHGCDSRVEVSLGAPVLVNDPVFATAATQWLVRAGFAPSPPLRSCGADDFSYFGSVVPSLMIFLGVESMFGEKPGLHHPTFLPPDWTVHQTARALMAGYLAACGIEEDVPLPP